MNHFGISGVFPIFSCAVLFLLCVGILWASERHDRKREWVEEWQDEEESDL